MYLSSYAYFKLKYAKPVEKSEDELTAEERVIATHQYFKHIRPAVVCEYTNGRKDE